MSLYKETLMNHFRNPKHKFAIDNYKLSKDGVNPSCGDNITLYINKDYNRVTDISYTGNGCAISMASADIMCDVIQNRENTEEIITDFIKMLEGKEITFDSGMETLNVFKEMQNYPARRSCAILPWKTLLEALKS